MSIKEELINQAFSETNDLMGVFEILPSNAINKYRILDEKKHKPAEMLPFLQNLVSETKKICSVLKETPTEIIANSSDYTFLITTIKTDGSSLVLMLPKEGNIGVAKVIAQRVVAQCKSK